MKKDPKLLTKKQITGSIIKSIITVFFFFDTINPNWHYRRKERINTLKLGIRKDTNKGKCT